MGANTPCAGRFTQRLRPLVAGDVQAQAEDSLPKPSSFCALGESVSQQLADLERDQLPLLENGDAGRMRSR